MEELERKFVCRYDIMSERKWWSRIFGKSLYCLKLDIFTQICTHKMIFIVLEMLINPLSVQGVYTHPPEQFQNHLSCCDENVPQLKKFPLKNIQFKTKPIYSFWTCANDSFWNVVKLYRPFFWHFEMVL